MKIVLLAVRALMSARLKQFLKETSTKSIPRPVQIAVLVQMFARWKQFTRNKFQANQ
jgi:hypothetical protein